MRDLKIAKKLTAVFAIIIACFCIAVVATILGMNNVGNSYESFYVIVMKPSYVPPTSGFSFRQPLRAYPWPQWILIHPIRILMCQKQKRP